MILWVTLRRVRRSPYSIQHTGFVRRPAAQFLVHHRNMTSSSRSSFNHVSPQAQTVLDTIQQRRSVDISKLSTESVPTEVIEAILTAGIWAPNHGQREPWRFTVFTGEARQRLGDILATSFAASEAKDADSEVAQQAQRERPLKAPVWISLELHIPEPARFPEWEEEAALACAVQNMLLAATAFGLASKWVTSVAMQHPLTSQALGAPRIMGFIYLGYLLPGETLPESKRTPLKEKVTWA